MNNALSTEVMAQTIDSREVAGMLEMRHADVLRKVDGYIAVLLNAKLRSDEYFIEDTYKDSSGKENKCYLFTRLGCDFIANKFVGEKGIIFTAKYVKRFRDMEQGVFKPEPNDLKIQAELNKIKVQEKRAEAMLLNAQARTFKTLMAVLDNKQLSPIAVQVFGLKGLESVFGVDVGNYLPETGRTYSATEVGQMIGGISANKVGIIANKNNIKTDEYGIWVMDKSKNSAKEVPSFRYNEKGVKKLKELSNQ